MIAPGILPFLGDSSPEPTAFLGWLAANWPLVDKSFETLSQSCNKLSTGFETVGTTAAVLTASVALIQAELGDKSQDIQDRDVWTAIRNIQMSQGEAPSPAVLQQLVGLSDRNSRSELRLDDAESRLASVVQENDQKNCLLLQQLRGLADAFPCHVGPCKVLVNKFTSQGGANYGDLLDQCLNT